MGELAGRYGRRRVIGFAIAFMPIGVVLTLPDSLWLTIIGVGVITIGFFGGHSIASSWVGLRADNGQGAGKRALPLLLLRGLEPGGLDRRLGLHPRRMAGRGRIRRRAVCARASHRLEARPRASAGASSRFVSGGGWPHGMARRGAHHRRPQARRGFDDRRSADARARPPSRPRARRTVGAAARDAATRQYDRPRLARPARRASGLLRRRAALAPGRQVDGKRAGAGRNQLCRRAGAGAARARSASRQFTRRRASSPTRSTIARSRQR